MSNNLIVMLLNKLKESKQMSRISELKANRVMGIPSEKISNEELSALKLKPKQTIEMSMDTKLSNEQYFQIVALYEFLKDNEDLSNEEVKAMLKSRLKFSFLRKLDKRFPNMIEELREHGPKYVSIMYDKINQEKQADKVLKVRLP